MNVTIDGLEFEMRDGQLFAISPQKYEVLCRVVELAWSSEPSRLLEGLQNETGYGWEGEVTYAYHHEEPNEIPPNKVYLHYLELEETVDIAEFTAFVLKYAKAHIELEGADNSWIQTLSPQLLAKLGLNTPK